MRDAAGVRRPLSEIRVVWRERGATGRLRSALPLPSAMEAPATQGTYRNP